MWLYIVIAIPFLFVVGVIYNAIKEQKRLENGKLKEILEKRRIEEEEYKKRTGRPLVRKDPYDDE